MTDWKLVNDAVLAVEWIAETNNLENANKKIFDLWMEKFHPKYPGERLFNNGVLMMASYLLFVYIQEKEYKNFDYTKINTEDFKIEKEEKGHNSSKKLCRRLRNAVSHGRFSFEDSTMVFEDFERNGTNYIRFSIETIRFGEFISNFLNAVNVQLVEKNKTLSVI